MTADLGFAGASQSASGSTQRRIWTIGHGGRDVEELLALAETKEVDVLVDVRSSPYSRWQPDFDRERLDRLLRDKKAAPGPFGATYLFMGDQLGGRPSDPSVYVDGKVDYELVRESKFFREGINRLDNGLRLGHRILLLCSEKRPEDCHRSKLIGVDLVERDIEVAHIDNGNSEVVQREVMHRLTGGQETLFGEHETVLRSRYTKHGSSGS